MIGYDAVTQSILDYYGTGSTIWNKIQTGSATADEINFALSRIPRVQMDVSKSGSVLGFKYADPVYLEPTGIDDILGFDSNTSSAQYSGMNSYNANIPANFSNDGGNIVINGGSTGAGGVTLATVADRAGLAITGINIGAKLGKAIDETLYNLDPEWWDNNFPTINPQTWDDIAGENELGQTFIRTLFDIKPDGTTTAYVDENVVAQTYQLLRDKGVMASDYKVSEIINPPADMEITSPIRFYKTTGYFNPVDRPDDKVIILATTTYDNRPLARVVGVVGNPNVTEIAGSIRYIQSSGRIQILVSCNDSNIGYDFVEGDVFLDTLKYRTGGRLANPGTTYTYNDITVGRTSWNSTITGDGYDPETYTFPPDKVKETAWLMINGDAYTPDVVDGINDIPNAIRYPDDNITGTTLDEVLQQLKTEYPDLFQDSITESTLQPDGSIKTRTYVPIPWVATDNDTSTSPLTQPKPTTQPYTDAQTHTTIDEGIATQILTQTDTSTDTGNPPPTTPPDTGDGDTPTSILPVGNASSLWSVYNPTQAQVDSFGAWLWSSNFIEQIKKLFADPMQAIIGIHKVYATPITGETRNIICGYIDSNVPSKIVTNQYTNIDCGTISLREYFGSVMDYAPYTKVKLYLPFIGIVPLDVADIMRSTISVKYKVDVFTGACLAQVEVIRDNAGGTLYTYSGSCIVSYPLSSGSYAGIITGVLSAVSGLATSVLTGGNPIPAMMGAGNALLNSHTDVSNHGSFTGCAGAMGIKIPYLIITRPQVITPSKSGEYYGYPSPYITQIGLCDGYIKCKETHVNIPNATQAENDEINNILLTGMYMDSTYTGNGTLPPETTIYPITISENGNYSASGDVDGYSPIYVNVPNTYTELDENKVVIDGNLVAQTPYPDTITENGTYDTTENNSVDIEIPLPEIYKIGNYGGGDLQSGDLIVSFNGYNGYYAIIEVCTYNSNLPTPNGLTQIHKSSYYDNVSGTGATIYNYVFKYLINSDTTSITFTGTSTKGATVWCVNMDYSLEYINESVQQYYNTTYSISSKDTLFVVFGAPYRGSNTGIVNINSNKAIVNYPFNSQYMRHYSAIIYPTNENAITTFTFDLTTPNTGNQLGRLMWFKILGGV